MKPRQNSPKPQTDLFRQPLLNLRHELCKLSERLHDKFAPLYGDDGRPGESIRLMCGLHYSRGHRRSHQAKPGMGGILGLEKCQENKIMLCLRNLWGSLSRFIAQLQHLPVTVSQADCVALL